MLNFLPIPFYVFASMSLSSSGYFKFETIQIYSFVSGVVAGSFTIFYVYIVSFKAIQNKTDFLLRNINAIIGSVTTFMAILTIIKLFCN